MMVTASFLGEEPGLGLEETARSSHLLPVEVTEASMRGGLELATTAKKGMLLHSSVISLFILIFFQETGTEIYRFYEKQNLDLPYYRDEYLDFNNPSLGITSQTHHSQGFS